MSKDYLIPLAIVLGSLAIGVAVVFTQTSMPEDNVNGEPTGTPEKADLPEVTEADHIRGNVDAPVTILEYSDFECPFCQRFEATVKQAMEEYGEQVRLVFRHFPLEMHDEAMPAALASECVFEQAGDDGFWEFSDMIFEKQDQLGSDLYEKAASEIGVDMDTFRDCVESEKYLDKIEAQASGGRAAGVSGTPGSFVNGVELGGAAPYERLKSVIDSVLAQ